jgi:hypothetical protein
MTEAQWDTLSAALSGGKIAIRALMAARTAQGRQSDHLNEWLEENAKASELLIEMGYEIEMACEAAWS